MEGSAAPSARHTQTPTHKVELGLVCAGLYAVVGSLALWVRGGTSALRVDTTVTRLVDSVRVGHVAARAHLPAFWPGSAGGRTFVSSTFPMAGVALAVGLAGLAMRRRDPRAAALCLFGPPLAVLLTDVVLKPLVDRHTGAALAYPSGHATGAAAVAALAVILFHRWRGWRATAWFTPIALTLPAAMGLALVRLGFHYPTDVLGGTATGIATVVALAVLLGAERSTAPGDRPTPRVGT